MESNIINAEDLKNVRPYKDGTPHLVAKFSRKTTELRAHLRESLTMILPVADQDHQEEEHNKALIYCIRKGIQGEFMRDNMSDERLLVVAKLYRSFSKAYHQHFCSGHTIKFDLTSYEDSVISNVFMNAKQRIMEENYRPESQATLVMKLANMLFDLSASKFRIAE